MDGHSICMSKQSEKSCLIRRYVTARLYLPVRGGGDIEVAGIKLSDIDIHKTVAMMEQVGSTE